MAETASKDLKFQTIRGKGAIEPPLLKTWICAKKNLANLFEKVVHRVRIHDLSNFYFIILEELL